MKYPQGRCFIDLPMKLLPWETWPVRLWGGIVELLLGSLPGFFQVVAEEIQPLL
jgi:hypothetical protein